LTDFSLGKSPKYNWAGKNPVKIEEGAVSLQSSGASTSKSAGKKRGRGSLWEVKPLIISGQNHWNSVRVALLFSECH
jgi:hypothetical protein